MVSNNQQQHNVKQQDDNWLATQRQTIKLSQQLMGSTNVKQSLQLLADFISAEVVPSDGIKIIQLSRDGELGTFIEYSYHSEDDEFKGRRKVHSHLSPTNEGLVEGGLRSRKGLIVNGEQMADGSLRYACFEQGQSMSCYREPIDESTGGESTDKDFDKEFHMLLYPLKVFCKNETEAKVVGMLFLWREIKNGIEPELYQHNSLNKLTRLLPFLLLAFEHILLLERHEKERHCLTEIYTSFKPDISIEQAFATILQQIGVLSGARHLLLLEQNSTSKDVCYSIANWSFTDEKTNKNVDTKQRFEQAFKHFYYTGEVDSIVSEVQVSASQLDLSVRSQALVVEVPEHGLHGGVKALKWIICLLDSEQSGYENVMPAYLWGNPTLLNQLFAAGTSLFSQYLESHIRFTIRQLNKFRLDKNQAGDGDELIKALLQDTANKLQLSLNCGSVLIYQEEYAPKVICTSPVNDKLIDTVIDGVSLSAKSLEEGLTQFVFDMQANFTTKPYINESELVKIAHDLDCKHIHSWVATPIAIETSDLESTAEQIKRGIIKVVTTEQQPYLNIANVKLLEAVAQRTFRQVSELQHHQMLIVLNDICNQLALLHGDELSTTLVSLLRNKWLRTYIRYHCELVVLARTTHGDQLVFGCSEEMQQIPVIKQHHWLYLSKQLEDDQVHTFSAHEKIPFGAEFDYKLDYEAMAVPISITGDAELCGHFFLFSHKKLKQYQADSCTYRHTILSATQGVASNAKLITKRVKQFLTTTGENWPEAETLRRCAARINSEVVRIRNWSHLQRVVYSEHVEPSYKLCDLRVDVRDWLARFEEMAAYAGVKLVNRSAGDKAVARYDSEMIDVAFSNLIENALKYSPKGGFVTVNYEYMANDIKIEVASAGSEIPIAIKQSIFEYGNRGTAKAQNDVGANNQSNSETPGKRIIPGQGIGL
jgi:hypothetical protein